MSGKKAWSKFKRYHDYRFSNYGEILSLKGEPKLLRLHSSKFGFLICCLDGDRYLLHRIIAKMFVHNPLHKYYVIHKDGDKQNNHFKNLKWADRKEYDSYAKKNGNYNFDYLLGAKNNKTKLTEKDIIEIRSLIKFGFSDQILSEIYPCNRVTINNIKNRKTWGHV